MVDGVAPDCLVEELAFREDLNGRSEEVFVFHQIEHVVGIKLLFIAVQNFILEEVENVGFGAG